MPLQSILTPLLPSTLIARHFHLTPLTLLNALVHTSGPRTAALWCRLAPAGPPLGPYWAPPPALHPHPSTQRLPCTPCSCLRPADCFFVLQAGPYWAVSSTMHSTNLPTWNWVRRGQGRDVCCTTYLSTPSTVFGPRLKQGQEFTCWLDLCGVSTFIHTSFG